MTLSVFVTGTLHHNEDSVDIYSGLENSPKIDLKGVSLMSLELSTSHS